MQNISPLRYPGGKTKACSLLYKIYLENFEILPAGQDLEILNALSLGSNNSSQIISPFFGGGSFEFYLQNKHNLQIKANDKFFPVYNFWNCCKNEKDGLYKKLNNKIDNTTITKQKFDEYKSFLIYPTHSLIEQAMYYFIINRCSFSGACLSGRFSKDSSTTRFTQSSIDRVKNLDLSKFTISNLDFEVFLNNSEDSFIFLDPPYYDKSKLYGNKGDLNFNESDHLRLYEILTHKNNWMLCYNDCEFIRGLYSDYKIISVGWKYGMNRTKVSSEIVIIKN